MCFKFAIIVIIIGVFWYSEFGVCLDDTNGMSQDLDKDVTVLELQIQSKSVDNKVSVERSDLNAIKNNRKKKRKKVKKDMDVKTDISRSSQEKEKSPKNLRKKNGKKKRKQKNPNVVSPTLSVSPSSIPMSTENTPSEKKKRRKKKRKKTPKNNNILEITTAAMQTKNQKNLSNVNKSDIVDLIEKLNRNPEDDFKKFLIPKKAKSQNSTKIKRNRCAKNNGGCSQICFAKGKRKCVCSSGYFLAKNKKTCTDFNECITNNGGCEQKCQNTQGGFYCDCVPGMRISDDGRTCQDIDECLLRNGHGLCHGSCLNTYGSYVCGCGNGTQLAKDNVSCIDIDECAKETSGCSHNCINAHGRTYCSCPEGMVLMSDWKTCQDIDECENLEIPCKTRCVNTIGSYYCDDGDIFQNDQENKILVCPPLDTPKIGFITCSRNEPTPYDTFSKTGRRFVKNVRGTKCQLNCPIGFELVGNGELLCGTSGEWVWDEKGFCSKASTSLIKCPDNQNLTLIGTDTMQVSFSPPKTVLSWELVKSHPEWAKNLQGELGVGHYNIIFSVTDPTTKLSSKCSFSIIISL